MTARLHLLTYDIASPTRLRAVARIAEEHGVRLQYSVFVMPLTRAAKQQLIERLARIIEEHEDDIRIYPLPSEPSWELHGCAMWPQGMWLSLPLPQPPNTHRNGES